tara:strand:- start:26 stop:616 length:591 start_codon:yes stop_codon:yes gene_type:complete
MILSLIKIGIKTLLENVCEEIDIKSINILNKDYTFRGRIDKLNINAESIIYRNIYAHKLNIYIKNLYTNFQFRKNPLLIESFFADFKILLSKENINKILCHNKWLSIKSSIESFISTKGINSIDIKNNVIFFIVKGKYINKFNYSLEFYKNNILLVNNINKNSLQIPIDTNINIKSLSINNNFIDISLSTKILFNS